MDFFNLPHTTKVNRVIPKNAFDTFTTSKQKKLFGDLVLRITWLHKISANTVNLKAGEVVEIQVIHIVLKQKSDIQSLLNIIEKAIPYTIVFVVEAEFEMFISTSIKHKHATNEDNAVIDWVFKTDWITVKDRKYELNLTKSLDFVYLHFCKQLVKPLPKENISLKELVDYARAKERLIDQIELLRKRIKTSKIYKEKVDLNIQLGIRQTELNILLDNK